ncbi:hypothetical protein OIU84_001977 [Salix udensis]|uniref:Uncharacterized protein n=1 Tax=Salix udensis TaxID=889485 RepID=A0AAD6P6M8_9ROSI|nr:hypothetical protein OIU84_001977 [Salix udensis]
MRTEHRPVVFYFGENKESPAAGKMNGAGGDSMINGSSHSSSAAIHRPAVRITVLFLGVLAVSCLVLYMFDLDSISMLYNRTSRVSFPFIILLKFTSLILFSWFNIYLKVFFSSSSSSSSSSSPIGVKLSRTHVAM